MADRKLSASQTLATEPADNDVLLVLDVSDTTDGASGTTKKSPWTVFKSLWVRQSLATASGSFLVSSAAGSFVEQSLSQVKGILGLATDYVAKSMYGANQVLYATSASNPTGTTIAEQQVLGRITGGNIKGLSVSELVALVLSGALPENVSIILDSALSTSGTYSGIVEAGVAGQAFAFGNLGYLATTGSIWKFTDANSETTSAGKLGICVSAGGSASGSASTFLLWGKVRADGLFPLLTGTMFVSTTAGAIQSFPPTGTLDVVRLVGYANSSSELHFNPSSDFFEKV